MTVAVGVTAVVLASRGGERLGRALAALEWAAERVVLDPAGRLEREPLPAGVRRAPALGMAAAPWLLLVQEDEVVTAPLATAVGEVCGGRGERSAYRIPLEVHALGARLRLRRAPVRLARSAGARFVFGTATAVALAGADGPAGLLAAPLVARRATSLAEAVEDLDGESAAVAALLGAARRPARIHHLLLAPLGAAAHVLCARGSGNPRWTRWALAVLAGYGTMVAYARLWELRQREEVPHG